MDAAEARWSWSERRKRRPLLALFPRYSQSEFHTVASKWGKIMGVLRRPSSRAWASNHLKGAGLYKVELL